MDGAAQAYDFAGRKVGIRSVLISAPLMIDDKYSCKVNEDLRNHYLLSLYLGSSRFTH